MKKDSEIEKLFDVEPAEETPKEELLTPALYELAKLNAEKKAKKRFAIRFGAAFSAAALILIASLSVLLPRFMPANKGDMSASPEAVTPLYYSASDVVESAVLSDTALGAVPTLTHISGDAVLPERVTEYRFADGKEAYVCAEMRRKGRYGIEDVRIVVEFTDGVLEDYGDYYSLISGGLSYVTSYDDGENVCKCAYEKDGVRFYVTVMCAYAIETEYYKKIFA